MKTLLLISHLGGINATALLKHIQQNDLAHHMHLKMAIVCEHTAFL